MRPAIVAVTGLVLVVVGMGVVLAADDGLRRERVVVASTPVSVLAPAGEGPFPGVVVAHGFCASGRIMEAIGIALARAGWVVAMPDLPGHGANLAPLSDADLPATVTAVHDWMGSRPDVDSLALLGHSMGAGAVTRAAPLVSPTATVAVSLPSADDLDPGISSLLLLVGSGEPSGFRQAADDAEQIGYPVRVVPLAEHISILFRTPTLQESVTWLGDAVGAGPSTVATDWRMPAVAMVYLGSAVLFWPISGVLARRRTGWEPARRPLLPLLVAMPLAGALAGVLLAVAPGVSERFPLLLGGYLAVFVGVTGALGWLVSRRWERPVPASVVPGVAMGLYGAVALLLPAHLSWAEVSLAGPRAVAFVALLVAWTLFAWAELLLAWRRGSAGYGVVVANRLVVAGLLSALAVLGVAPGFLLILAALLLIMLPWFGAYGVRLTRLTGSPLAGALAQAPALAGVVAVATPVA